MPRIGPQQIGALLRLAVQDLPGPAVGLREEVDAVVVDATRLAAAVHDADHPEVGAGDGAVDLLPRLAGRGHRHLFLPVQVAGDDAVVAVLVSMPRVGDRRGIASTSAVRSLGRFVTDAVASPVALSDG